MMQIYADTCNAMHTCICIHMYRKTTVTAKSGGSVKASPQLAQAKVSIVYVYW